MFHVKHGDIVKRDALERWIRTIPVYLQSDTTEKSVSRQCLIAKRFFLFPHITFTAGIGPIRFLRNHLPHWGRLFMFHVKHS